MTHPDVHGWQPISAAPKRCPIEDPHFCLGTRCQLHGICDFNRRLREGQQRLGAEFETVLYANLWDLYLR